MVVDGLPVQQPIVRALELRDSYVGGMHWNCTFIFFVLCVGYELSLEVVLYASWSKISSALKKKLFVLFFFFFSLFPSKASKFIFEREATKLDSLNKSLVFFFLFRMLLKHTSENLPVLFHFLFLFNLDLGQ